MGEYIPDNYDIFVAHESEQERLKRLKERFEYEWEKECEEEED